VTFRTDNSILVLIRFRQLKARKNKKKKCAIHGPWICRQALLSATALLAGQHRASNSAPKHYLVNQQKFGCPANDAARTEYLRRKDHPKQNQKRG